MADGVRKDEEFSGTKEVEERHRIDEASLDRWMKENVEDYQGPLKVLQFKGGQSNPTYKIETPARSYVMRRRPFGKLLPSAHAVDREFRVIAALGKQNFPVARAYALCTDDAVVGSAFYIMSMEEGRVFWDPTLPSQRPDARREMFTSKIETLAKLHTLNPEKIGLADFGKPGNYFARQVDRWTRQYRASETQHIPEFEKLAEWLPKTVPPQERVSIVHGDYRLDNLIFHATESRVQAVLDWELSTLGDPMADFTYLLMQWTMPGLANADLKALNIPSQDEAAQIYCDVTGIAVPDLNWYFSYNLFRLAGITQGIAGRIRDGTAANAKAIEFGCAHGAVVEGILGIRAEGRRALNFVSPHPACGPLCGERSEFRRQSKLPTGGLSERRGHIDRPTGNRCETKNQKSGRNYNDEFC